MSKVTISRLSSYNFNSTLFDLDFQVPKTNKLMRLNSSNSCHKFNPSQQCTLGLLEVSRLKSVCIDTDKSFSDSSMTEYPKTERSAQKYLSTFEDESDDEIVMFSVQ